MKMHVGKHIIITLTVALLLLAPPCLPKPVGMASTGAAGEGVGTSTAYGASKNASVANAVPRIRLKSGEGKIAVEWKRVPYASGYQIYRSAGKKKKFKKIATLRKAGKNRYVDRAVKNKKQYRYKLRTFRKTANGICYSRFSAVKQKSARTRLQIRTDAFIRKATKSSMTKEQKLRACYKYMRDHYRYINRAVVETGTTGWVNRYASRFFKDKGGNCCSWAAAYTTAAKRLGFPAKAISGRIYYSNGTLWGRHGWTEIKIDGKTFVFDPEIEYSYRKRGNKINLYKIDAVDNGLFLYKKK